MRQTTRITDIPEPNITPMMAALDKLDSIIPASLMIISW